MNDLIRNKFSYFGEKVTNLKKNLLKTPTSPKKISRPLSSLCQKPVIENFLKKQNNGTSNLSKIFDSGNNNSQSTNFKSKYTTSNNGRIKVIKHFSILGAYKKKFNPLKALTFINKIYSNSCSNKERKKKDLFKRYINLPNLSKLRHLDNNILDELTHKKQLTIDFSGYCYRDYNKENNNNYKKNKYYTLKGNEKEFSRNMNGFGKEKKPNENKNNKGRKIIKNLFLKQTRPKNSNKVFNYETKSKNIFFSNFKKNFDDINYLPNKKSQSKKPNKNNDKTIKLNILSFNNEQTDKKIISKISDKRNSVIKNNKTEIYLNLREDNILETSSEKSKSSNKNEKNNNDSHNYKLKNYIQSFQNKVLNNKEDQGNRINSIENLNTNIFDQIRGYKRYSTRDRLKFKKENPNEIFEDYITDIKPSDKHKLFKKQIELCKKVIKEELYKINH